MAGKKTDAVKPEKPDVEGSGVYVNLLSDFGFKRIFVGKRKEEGLGFQITTGIFGEHYQFSV